MANINMSFDTKTKTFDLSINGTKIENVDSVNVYRYGKDAEISISVRTPETEDGICVQSYIMASNKETVKADCEIRDMPEVDSAVIQKAAYAIFGRECPEK